MRLPAMILSSAILAIGADTGAVQAEDFAYVVRPGDTLIGIGG